MAIVYFIQPSELVGTDRYKIGRSAKDDLSRMKGYKNGSRYLAIMECDDDVKLEKILITKFNDKFLKIAGNEFFQGNELEMLSIFIQTVIDYKENKIKQPVVDWMTKYSYKYDDI
jgi:hypothetical protein